MEEQQRQVLLLESYRTFSWYAWKWQSMKMPVLKDLQWLP